MQFKAFLAIAVLVGLGACASVSGERDVASAEVQKYPHRFLWLQNEISSLKVSCAGDQNCRTAAVKKAEAAVEAQVAGVAKASREGNPPEAGLTAQSRAQGILETTKRFVKDVCSYDTGAGNDDNAGCAIEAYRHASDRVSNIVYWMNYWE